ncbi:MAG: pitrilysin family protein [candidate division WOR-3 bacterium]
MFKEFLTFGARKNRILLLIISFITTYSFAQFFWESKLAVMEYELKNGLKVLIYVDSSAPIVSTQMWYKVGSYYEPSGYTGISHLLEHMGFKGTKKYGPGEFSQIIDENGGEDNAFTSELYTSYYTNLAKDRYEIALELEAERMCNLLLDKDEFELEKKVVMEERRLGENSPGSVLWEQFFATAYLVHPFRTPVIGWMDDLERITRDDLYQYYRTYYTPQNAVLVVAGDVKPVEVIKKVEKYFSKIKSKPVPKKNFYNAEPPQTGERRIKLKRDVKTPTLMIGYHVCGLNDPEFYVLEVIEGILFRGKSARCYKRLVHELGLTIGIWGGNDTEKDPGMFYFYAMPRTTELLDSTEKMIYQELEYLKSDTVTTEELTRVKNQVIASSVFSRDRIPSIARAIGRYTITTGSYKFIEEYPKKIATVTKEDIMRVAKQYFSEDNRTVAILIPKEAK